MKPWLRTLSHIRQAWLCVPVTRMLGSGDRWTLGLVSQPSLNSVSERPCLKAVRLRLMEDTQPRHIYINAHTKHTWVRAGGGGERES